MCLAKRLAKEAAFTRGRGSESTTEGPLFLFVKAFRLSYTRRAMKKVLAAVLDGLMALATFGVAGCSRNNIEAVNLANEGDKAKATDIDGAISKYEQATNLDPTNHRILWKLGIAYTKKEHWDKVATTGEGREDRAETRPLLLPARSRAGASGVKGPTSWADAKGPLEEAISSIPNIAGRALRARGSPPPHG